VKFFVSSSIVPEILLNPDKCPDKSPDKGGDQTRQLQRRALRRMLMAQRYSMSAIAIKQQNAAIVRAALQRLSALPANTVIALYLPHAGEPNLLALAQDPSTAHLRFVLPVVLGKQQALGFSQWQHNEPLHADAYGIAVPVQKNWLRPDVLLVPCVGYNPQGYRLGYGGGYYDRTLAALWDDGKKPMTIGIAWRSACCAFAPAAHDIAMSSMIVA
jgi:5,10-methenyltetrahydrofolate synthetase